MKVKSESEVTQSCPTLSDPMDCSLPGSSVHVIFQARVLEWGAKSKNKLFFLQDMLSLDSSRGKKNPSLPSLTSGVGYEKVKVLVAQSCPALL